MEISEKVKYPLNDQDFQQYCCLCAYAVLVILISIISCELVYRLILSWAVFHFCRKIRASPQLQAAFQME